MVRIISWIPGLKWNWGVFLEEASVAFMKRLRSNSGGKVFTQPQGDSLKSLADCTPMTVDLDQEKMSTICKAISKNQEVQARALIEAAKTETARGWCIDALKGAVTLICTCGPDVLREATYNLLGTH